MTLVDYKSYKTITKKPPITNIEVIDGIKLYIFQNTRNGSIIL